jgi:hypothetical protein
MNIPTLWTRRHGCLLLNKMTRDISNQTFIPMAKKTKKYQDITTGNLQAERISNYPYGIPR